MPLFPQARRCPSGSVVIFLFTSVREYMSWPSHVHPESLIFLDISSQCRQLPGLPVEAEEGNEQKNEQNEGADEHEIE